MLRETSILRLRGSRALSPFRRDKLLSRLRARVPAVASVDAWYWHFVALRGDLTPEERAVLVSLLDYGPVSSRNAPAPEDEAVDAVLLVVPRPGTISLGRPRPPTSLGAAG